MTEAQVLKSKWKNIPGNKYRYFEGSKHGNLAFLQPGTSSVRNVNVLNHFKSSNLYSCLSSICLLFFFFVILIFQATANLVPLSERRVAVKFDAFKIAGLVCDNFPIHIFLISSHSHNLFMQTSSLIPFSALQFAYVLVIGSFFGNKLK